MSSIGGIEMNAMWRLSEDFNAARRFTAFKMQHPHRPTVIYNGTYYRQHMIILN